MTDDELFGDDIPHPADSPPADASSGAAVPGPFDGGAARGPSPFAEGLNPDQLDAVVHESGPLLVIAGAGSGKTRVLTHRIAHLIHMGVHPSKILAITFTNKAAAEMRERVGALVGPVVKTMWVSTFHSACVRILRGERRPARLSPPVLDLRRRRLQPSHRLRDPRPRPRRQALHPPRRPRDHQSLEERTGRPGGSPAPGAEHLRPQARRRLRRVPGSPAQGGCDGLRRPAHQHRQAVPRAPRRARALPPALPAHPRRRVPGHQPGPERDGAPARRRPSQRVRSRRYGPECVQISRRRLPQHHRLRGGVPRRHHGDPRPELPQHPDDPRRRQRRDRQQRRAQAEVAVDRQRGGGADRALPRRGRGRRGHVGRRYGPAAPRRRRHQLPRDGGALPHQRPVDA